MAPPRPAPPPAAELGLPPYADSATCRLAAALTPLLAEAPVKATLRDLAALGGFSYSTASTALAALRRAGWVSCDAPRQGARSVLTLLPKGSERRACRPIAAPSPARPPAAAPAAAAPVPASATGAAAPELLPPAPAYVLRLPPIVVGGRVVADGRCPPPRPLPAVGAADRCRWMHDDGSTCERPTTVRRGRRVSWCPHHAAVVFADAPAPDLAAAS